jgi:acetyl-CoA acetyltransferase
MARARSFTPDGDARMVVTMLTEMRRRDVQLACIAMRPRGGMSSAIVLELV